MGLDHYMVSKLGIYTRCLKVQHETNDKPWVIAIFWSGRSTEVYTIF